MKSRRSVFLVPANKRAVRRLIAQRGDLSGTSWIYIGRDIRFFRWLEDMEYLGKHIDIADDLQDTAQRYRQDYIDYVGQLSSQYTSLFWWLSSFSEKNPFISHSFLYFCYCKVAYETVRRETGDVIVVGESRAVLQSLSVNLQQLTEVCPKIIDPWGSRFYELINTSIQGTLKKCWFLMNTCQKIAIARIYSLLRWNNNEMMSPQGDQVIIHSWADHRSFHDPARYSDSYFGDLQEIIQKTFPDTFYLIKVLPTFSYLKAIRHLLNFDDRIILFEECLRFWDPLRAIVTVRSNFPQPTSVPVLDGLDITYIIQEQFSRDRKNPRIEESYLYYLAARRLCARFSLHSFVYTFENHIWEKMYCAGIRAISPNTTLIGYQHSTILPMELCYSRSLAEKSIMPIPDKILVVGKIAKETLVRSGFDPTTLTVVGAYRYQHLSLHTDQVKNKKCATTRNSPYHVLVATSADLDESLEVLEKSIQAFGDMPECNVTIKCHPTVKFDMLYKYLSKIPSNFSISEKSLEDLLPQADLMLYASSSVAVEALAVGLPVMHIRSDFKINMNIFESISYIPSISRPDKIRTTAEELILRGTLSYDLGKKIVSDFFAPVSDDAVICSIKTEDRDTSFYREK